MGEDMEAVEQDTLAATASFAAAAAAAFDLAWDAFPTQAQRFHFVAAGSCQVCRYHTDSAVWAAAVQDANPYQG